MAVLQLGRVWVWLALEHQTRKIVGIAFGNRSEETWLELWLALPANYRQREVCVTDDLACYAAVLPAKRHRNGRKGSGKTNCIECFNNSLRQRWPNLVRKTLSFRIDHYNAELSV